MIIVISMSGGEQIESDTPKQDPALSTFQKQLEEYIRWKKGLDLAFEVVPTTSPNTAEDCDEDA